MDQDARTAVEFVFASAVDALDWFDQVRSAGLVADRAGLFQRDGLDDRVESSGVPGTNRLIVRSVHDGRAGRVDAVTATTVTTT